MRKKEHMKDIEQNVKKQFTRAARKDSQSELNKSAITDHVNKYNHIMDWNKDKILTKEPNHKKQLVREAMYIQRQGQTMNRDQGNHQLSNQYNNFLLPGGTTSPLDKRA